MINYSKNQGLVPVIVQDAEKLDVLMLAYMNKEAFDLTLKTGFAHYYSRSKNRIWKKGESSGHVQTVVEVRVDCDEDTVLLKVNQAGAAACHEGYRSCFFRKMQEDKLLVDMDRVFNPGDVYKD